ncbi:MAG: YceI family protein [Bacteroidia bacterium]|nr:YceI family protein [Bacteroidia bacterium]NNM22305.1 polyisoprenoid-binding protein [Flavobacteriaceae bacterium]
MKFITFFFTLSVLFLFNLLSAQNYLIDDSHSSVLMEVQRFGVVNVVGRFGDVQGSMDYDPSNKLNAKVEISVSVASYLANNPGGETSARSEVFLDAENHPRLSFSSTQLMEEEGIVYMKGNLTIKGVTKEIKFPVTFTGPAVDLPTRKQSIALSGTMEINRLDFGVGPDRALPDGREIIGNKVEIHLDILGIAK